MKGFNWQNWKLRDDDLKIIFVDQNHLNKKTSRLLIEDKLSTYDIGMNDIKFCTRDAILKWIPRGYSVVFKHGERSKILQYNK